MKLKFPSRVITSLHLLVGVLVASSVGVQATPYATCLTNSGSSISFRLNEAADNVKIISSAGAVTNELGPVAKGLTVTNLTITGVYKIEVTKTAGAGYLLGVANQISTDTDNTVKFFDTRGVAVNKNPASPYFGRTYVSSSRAGTTVSGRATKDGIYILNADQTDAVGQGDTALTGGVNGGLGFDRFAANAESPGRLIVGPDDNIYITDWSDAHGGLYVTDPNVATNAAATNVLAFLGGPSTTTNNHGSLSAVWVEGSLANNDLVVFTQDEDLVPKNSVWRYTIGGGPLAWTANADGVEFSYGLNSQFSDIIRGPDGKWYCTNRRLEFATAAGIFVRSSDGTTALWNSLSAYRTWIGNPTARDSYFGHTMGLDISPDGKYLASIRGATNNPSPGPYIPPFVGGNTVLILPLEDGVPNITNLIVMPTTPGTATGRDISFDAAGNIYTVSSGQELLRVYTPGGFSAATTGSDGTFTLLAPSTKVRIEADTNLAYEAGATTSVLTLTRTNDTADYTLPQPVTISVAGTAIRGSDYVLKTNGVTFTENTVTIPAGSATLAISLVATDDSTAELTETATISVVPALGYSTGTPGLTSVDIVDNETPTIDISTVSGSIFEGNPFDYARLRLTRRGDTNQSFTVNLTYSGDAAANVDFTTVDTVGMNPGDVSVDLDISPINDSLLETNQTFTITVASGSGYVPGTASTTATIVEDETPPASVLLADNFNGDSSADWTVRFASGNGVDDYHINESFVTFPNTPRDYSTESYTVTPAPHDTDTLGLKLTVNKGEPTALGAAGVNLYRNGHSFSNNYALRFDLYTALNTGAGTTENVLFGINHSGNNTNWFRAGGNGYTNSSYDGLWFTIGADGAALGQFNGGAGSGDFIAFGGGAPIQVGGIWGPASLANRLATSFGGAFKTPPWVAAGVPSNAQGSGTPSWAQVEVSQVGNIITLKINNTSILSYTNHTGSKSGTIMLGYDDAFDSNTGSGGAAFFDNLRVVNLGYPTITAAALTGPNVTLNFSWTLDDSTTAFKVQRATAVAGPYTDDTGATIVKLAPGSYQAVSAKSGDAAFYRIRR